jgi:3-methyladenine DNA glycosylase AlkC
VATDASKQLQEQVLEAIKQSQDAALEAISTWSESVAKLVPKLPELPTLPIADVLPKAAEQSDQLFEFAQQLLSSQQNFVQRLVAALPGQEDLPA